MGAASASALAAAAEEATAAASALLWPRQLQRRLQLLPRLCFGPGSSLDVGLGDRLGFFLGSSPSPGEDTLGSPGCSGSSCSHNPPQGQRATREERQSYRIPLVKLIGVQSEVIRATAPNMAPVENWQDCTKCTCCVWRICSSSLYMYFLNFLFAHFLNYLQGYKHRWAVN